MIEQDRLLEKINSLPPGKIDEVLDFIDFLSSRQSPDRAEMSAKIAAYAESNAGTEFDLDTELEVAGIENLILVDGDAS